MTRAWKLIALIIAIAVLIPFPVGGQSQPASTLPPTNIDNAFGKALEKCHYVAVPLIQDEIGGCFTVEAQIGSEKIRLLIDTGAEESALDINVVKKLGLKPEREVIVAGVEGSRKGVGVSIRGLSIGKHDSRTMANSIGIAAFDFTAINVSREQRKLPHLDGLLGHSALDLNSAIIDYAARILYLRTPLQTLWSAIEGDWVSKSVHQDGTERENNTASPLRINFKDRCLHLTDGTNDYHFGLHVRRVKDHYVFLCFDPKQELADELQYRAGGLLKVVDGKLTMCLVLDAKKGLPTNFTSAKDDGRLLAEFRRDK